MRRATGTLWLYPGPGFDPADRIQIGSSGWNGMTELTGAHDITGDGEADLIAERTSDGTLWAYPGGASALGARTQIGTAWTGVRSITGIADVTGDGVADLLGVEKSTGTMYAHPGQGGAFGARKALATGWNG